MARWGRCVVLMAVGAAGGCASVGARSAAVSWTKPGADSETVRLEYGLCGGDFTGLGAMSFAPEDFAAIHACMSRKGFTAERR